MRRWSRPPKTRLRSGETLILSRLAGLHSRISRDLLWVKVNGYSILNVYRQPLNNATLRYITQLAPLPLSLIGGDFNAHHEVFERGSMSTHSGTELAQWANQNGMDFTGEPGQPPHRARHVLDVAFSNIPFATTTVRDDMHSGSDQSTLVTIIAARGSPSLDQFHYRVPEAHLHRFAALVELNIQGIPSPSQAQDSAQLDHCVSALSAALTNVIETAGSQQERRVAQPRGGQRSVVKHTTATCAHAPPKDNHPQMPLGGSLIP
jgi:hypothetical protein